MSFLFPIYGWALIGLLVPIGIHLWSRKQGKTIRVGSVQLFTEQVSKKSSSIQLNEWALLLLRLLILSLIVLAMAGPYLKSKKTQAPLAFVIAPEIFEQASLDAEMKAMAGEHPVYLLTEGIPLWDWDAELPLTEAYPSLWNYIPELERLSADSVVVITPGIQNTYAGGSPKTSKPMSWITPEQLLPEKSTIIEAVKNQQQAKVVEARSDGDLMVYHSNEYPLKDLANPDSLQVGNRNLAIKGKDTLAISLYYPPGRAAEATYLLAALRAISKFKWIPMDTQMVQDSLAMPRSQDTAVIWLYNTPPQFTSINTLRWDPDILAAQLITPGRHTNDYRLRHELTSESVLQQELPMSLIEFLKIDHPLKESMAAADQRLMDAQSLQPIFTELPKSEAKPSTMGFHGWIWLLVGMLFIFERVLSYLRNQ